MSRTPFTSQRHRQHRGAAHALGGLVLLLVVASCVPGPVTLTPPATLQATAAAPTMTPGAGNQNTWQSTSPDGQWIAEGSMEGPFMEGDQEKYRTRLTVRRADGQVTWPVIDQVSNYGLGYTVPVPLQWSADGERLYVTNQPVSDGCALFVDGSDLWQVDLTSGRLAEVVPAVGTSLALSPDETRLAIIGGDVDTELIVQLLDGGEVTRVPLAAGHDTVQAGNITWAPDGQSVLVTVAENPCQVGQWTQSIVFVGLAPVVQNILVDRDPRLLNVVSWEEAGRARLHDETGNAWWLDVTTGEVTSAQ